MGSTGNIESPKFDTPSRYPHHSSCSWLVTVDDAYLVTLNFSSLKLLDKDVINIYDGENENVSLLARYSRLNATGNVVSSSNSVFIILKYVESSRYNQSMFAFHYASQPKPTGTLLVDFLSMLRNFYDLRISSYRNLYFFLQTYS
jgi:hypothetical protein